MQHANLLYQLELLTMLTIQLDDDSERTLNKLAKQEHLQPQQLIKKLINNYAIREIKKTVLLADIINDLPQLPTFNNDPLTIQRNLRNEWD